MAKRERRSTSTSSFGAPGRESHDSSAFYNSRLYADQPPPAGQKTKSNPLPDALRNQVIVGTSEKMDGVPDGSIHLMVTSPPYNAQKDYDQDLTLAEYRKLLQRVMGETYRVLIHGGRACINIANLGRKPYLPLHAFIIEDMLALGFLMRGEIIWNKGSSAGSSTAWGSWLSASNPVLRDVHEYILIFSKETFKRPSADQQNSIERDQFLEWTKSIWTFPSVSARQTGHPAPFPEELPRRLIELYSFKGDVVLDPFCGSGTSCLAAQRAGRDFLGYDIQPEYVELARQRLSAESPGG